jgi:ATP-dependent RNA helicase DeaD
MPSFEDFHLHSTTAATLQRLGWSADDPLARESAPTVARGHNLVAVTPPTPAYAAPTLGGVISRLAEDRRALLLVPSTQLDEWGGLVHLLAEGTGLRMHVARGTARAMRHLRGNSLELLVTTPETALTLVARSALRMDLVDSLLLAWPESLLDPDSITPLMQDLGKEAQRIIYTSDPGRVASIAERYARKALTIGVPDAPALPAGPVRTVSITWSGRLRALADLIELIDPASFVVWTVDRQNHGTIAQVTAANPPEVHLVAGDAPPPPASAVIAFDLPTGARLRQLLMAGEVFLLVPPGTEPYVTRIAAPRRPVQLPGVLDAVRSTQSAQRSAVVQSIESGNLERALLTIAPLFERYDAPTVAAALYELWIHSAPTGPTPAPAAPSSATSKVFVGVGKKDGANANELVAVLTKELRVERSKIGRIELRDAYSLIELPAQEAEQVATALNGRTIRKKRVAARVDRGPTRGDGKAGGRPGPRNDRR